ncbi:uncharacterized protein LOC128325886 isoform X2 [Hemicordylus capensis]|uniref:uncharacterized protein LOC128325886 isoform X2 n=1 Tax=Hemicordylus capensis TaxID=884348 RepID=UPI0023048F8A|nr:uncharacterized protein LOC128325886 isoform X2 [Hemicordylus capensis]
MPKPQETDGDGCMMGNSSSDHFPPRSELDKDSVPSGLSFNIQPLSSDNPWESLPFPECKSLEPETISVPRCFGLLLKDACPVSLKSPCPAGTGLQQHGTRDIPSMKQDSWHPMPDAAKQLPNITEPLPCFTVDSSMCWVPPQRRSSCALLSVSLQKAAGPIREPQQMISGSGKLHIGRNHLLDNKPASAENSF